LKNTWQEWLEHDKLIQQSTIWQRAEAAFEGCNEKVMSIYDQRTARKQGNASEQAEGMTAEDIFLLFDFKYIQYI